MRNIVAACLILLLCVAGTILYLNESNSDTFDDARYKAAIGTNIPVLILGDDNESDKIVTELVFGTNNIRICSDFPSTEDEKIVIMCPSWIASKNRPDVDKYVRGLIDNDIAVTCIESYEPFLSNPLLNFISFSEEGSAFTIYPNPTGPEYTCYSADNSGHFGPICKTYCWINDKMTNIQQFMNLPDINWSNIYPSETDAYLEDYGCMYVYTLYSAVEENDPRYNCYVAKYGQTSVPDTDRYTADMYTEFSSSQSNLRYPYYEPTTTPGTTTVQIDLSAQIGSEFGLSGPSLNAGVGIGTSWSYSVPDIVINDLSHPPNYYKIWHDVDEDRNVGEYTLTIRPGKMIIVDCDNGEGNCTQVDTYSVQYCKKVWWWKEFSTLERNMFVNFRGLPQTMTVEPNGAEMFTEDRMPATSTTFTYSRGTHVLVPPNEYTHFGHSFLGYSTDQNSAVADYLPGDSFQIFSDITLYSIWS